MTTRVVVKKARQVAMAADTLVTFGDSRLSHCFEANTPLFRVDTSETCQPDGHGGLIDVFTLKLKASS